MREYEKGFNDYLTHGLADQKLRVNSPFFEVCQNLKITKQGLDNIKDFENITFSKSDSWPYPRLFNLPNYFIALFSDGVYQVGNDWSLTLISSINNPLEVIDFDEMIIVTSENSVKYLSYNLDTDVWTEFAVIGPKFKTGLNYKGQLICGNLNSDWEISGTEISLGSKGVAWSAIDELNFNPQERIDAGFAPIKYSNEVLRILELGDNIIVYGDSSIIALKPFTEPVVTFGQKSIKGLNRLGILNQFSVIDMDTYHIFIDINNQIWRLNEDLTITKLDYREHVKKFTDLIYMTRSIADTDCYISDGKIGYLLSEDGMSSLTNLTPQITDMEDNLIVSINEINNDIELVTIPFDFDVAAQKTITEIDLGLDTDGDVSIAIDWRMSRSSNFTRTPYRTPLVSGICPIVIAGIEFRLVIKVVNYTYTKFSSLSIKVKYTDKRSIRGPRVS